MKHTPAHETVTRIIRQSGSPGSLHVFELSHERAADKRLILLVEIEVSDKDNEGIIESIAHEIEQQFFNAPTKETEYAFENALAKANIRVKDILLVKPKNWLNKIHIVVAALAGSEIYLASVGSVHAFLVHHEKIVDVLKTTGPTAPSPNPAKLFTNIITGKLGPDTAMVLVNEAVLDYLSVERIRKCAEEFDSQEAIEALTEFLGRAPSNKQFGLAVISPVSYPAVQTHAVVQKIPQARSDNQIHEPRRSTAQEPIELDTVEDTRDPEKIDADDTPTALNERFEASGQAIQAFFKKVTPAAQNALTVLLSFLAKLLEGIQRAFKRGTPALVACTKTTLATIKNSDTRTYFFRRIKNAAGNAVYRATHAQSKKRQLAGVGVIVLIIIFTISISIGLRDKKQESATTSFETTISTIEQKINEAEASLIYGNKIKSQALLAETQAALAELAQEFPNQEDRITAAHNAITLLKDKAEKKQAITHIQTIATVLPTPIGLNETGLVQIQNSLFFYDGVQEKIASLDVPNKLLLSLSLDNQGLSSFTTALEASDTEIAALAKDTVLLIDTSRETITKQQFPFDPATAKPFASYGRNIYTFNTETNQIIRYRRAGAGFTSAQNWLTQEYELATMRDISVDGFVYLIDSQGTIHIFLRGILSKTIPWPAQDLPGSILKLYTREDINIFYVLDSERTRILKITKEGSLQTQLTAPILEKATDLTMDAKGENIYVLAGDKIYQIPVAQ
ncbi:hypothetical protein BK004_04990 [bacterium CG10_46_32]|nr:MAG: hypothetical protein BK004_04990 [bacterium CG10_46_32]PIR55670.1 MAG: hypothetical protein COU73_05040 [Parcubacteria group bacterium CG10_big_fil_rev_8_21_14_0_10_46_32]